MERLDRIASHSGTVLSVAPGRVTVKIEAVSACASCAAHSKCGFAESKDKTLEVPTADWQRYAAGQPVVVNIDQSRGLLAVWIAYLLPALLLIAAIVGLSLAGLPEGLVALAALLVLGLYLLILYLLRKRIDSRFILTLSAEH